MYRAAHPTDDVFEPILAPQESGGPDPFAALENWAQFDTVYPRPERQAPIEDHAAHFILVAEFAVTRGFFIIAKQTWLQRRWPALWFIWRKYISEKSMGLHDEALLTNTAVGRAHLAKLKSEGRLL